MEITTAPVDALVPYAHNANLHTDGQIDQIANSIREFGFRDPVGVWKNPHGQLEIVEGHGRVLAAKRLGMTELPVIRLDDLTDEQRRAYTHVHNQLTRASEFDFDVLDQELAELSFDFEALGFDGFTDVDVDDYGTDFELPDGDKPNVSQATFILAPEQRDYVMATLAMVDTSETETYGNTNKNGNALYEVVKQWAALRTCN